MKYIYDLFANLIIDGKMLFKDVVAKLKKGVAGSLKEKGREDLATDSNGSRKDD